jgi:hypothetical protein
MTMNYSVAELTQRAVEGIFDKAQLVDLLPSESRSTFLAACDDVEREFIRACTAGGDFCLAPGCALEGEVCLNALLSAGPTYRRACGRLRVRFFHLTT